jgi:1-deoxy-D-xylulose-5-phosphate synthase
LSLLSSINSPEDLKKIPKKDLPQLATEIREYMLDVVSKCGGHLAPSLGVVEITIALHYCYNTPFDKLIWDVGHQSYAHKILTERREQFITLRQFGGLSGFPRISESIYDTASVGHASTSISLGLGIAKARDIAGEKFHVISVIGDGSMSGGLAFEGLNNLGTKSTDMTIILNDNEMSISKNVGALSKYLTRIITDKRFNKLRNDVWELLGSMSNIGKKIRSMVHNVDEAMKRLVTPGKFFEDIGIRYLGPVDGHNINDLIDIFTYAKESATGPVLIHVLTKKGKGYSYAENDAKKFHGIGEFSKITGDSNSVAQQTPTYSEVFGKTLVELATANKDIVAITAAMPDGTGLQLFQERFPERFFDVGIAEGHATTFAAGLALGGRKPVVGIYSTFMQRAFDQIIHDVALDNLNVVFCLDRAGIVGNDGPTHHGCFDISYFRLIPNITIMAPSNEFELRDMLYTAILHCKGPVVIRYPRGNARHSPFEKSFTALPLYEPVVLREGKQIALVSIGEYRYLAETVCDILEKDGIAATHIDARFAKPLSEAFYETLFDEYTHLVTVESNAVIGGFGSSILELHNNVSNRKHFDKQPMFLTLGYPDEFIPHGNTDKLLESINLTPQAIAEKIKDFIKS